MRVEEIKNVKSKKGSQPKTVVKVVSVTKPKANRGRKSKSRRNNIPLETAFADAMLYPDLIGPCRLPVVGSDARASIAMERGRYAFTGSGTDIIKGVRLTSTVYGTSIAAAYSATGSAVGLSAGVAIAPSVSFPPQATVADGRLIAASLIISYTGNLLNCSGEVLLGCTPDSTSFTGTNYDSISFLPGVIRIPMVQIAKCPLRVALRHSAPQSWDFIVPAANVADVELPFVLTATLAAGQSVTVEIVKTYEVRSNIASSNQIPYSSSGAGRASDDAAMTNALDRLAKRVNMVTELLPSVREGLVGAMVEGLYESGMNVLKSSAESAGMMLVDHALSAAQSHARSNANRFAHSLLTL